MIRHLLLSTLLLIPVPMSGISADSIKPPAFADLDGDGINDNFADNDNSGIPDRFESKAAASNAPATSLLGDIFNAGLAPSGTEDLLSADAIFHQRRFGTRILVHRCHVLGGDADFGPGGDIGLGAMGGAGGCAGGACAP